MDPNFDEKWRGDKWLKHYGINHWFEHGLEKTLRSQQGASGLQYQSEICRKKRGKRGRGGVGCLIEPFQDVSKSVAKTLQSLEDAYKEGKSTEKLIEKLQKRLPERLTEEDLIVYAKGRGTCGFSPDMLENVREYRMVKFTPEEKALQAQCEVAYANLLEQSRKNEDYSFTASLWAAGYTEDKKKGILCEAPPEDLVNNVFQTGDPYASMPLDMNRPEHFRQFTPALDFSATQPLQSECEASFQGGTVMLTLSPLAKPKADESAWMNHYNSVRDAGGICNPIPKRLAEWGEDYVWQNGWPFTYDAATAKLDTCMEAVRVVANDQLGGEFARWVQGYNMRINYPETRRPSGDICQGIPKPLQADLFPRMEAAREIRRQEAAERQRQRDLDYANAPPPPPSFGEIVRQWQKDWQARPVVVERCYTNQFDRYVCYDKTYR
jgi:hypothetical protein